jgi:hypothetical protein
VLLNFLIYPNFLWLIFFTFFPSLVWSVSVGFDDDRRDFPSEFFISVPSKDFVFTSVVVNDSFMDPFPVTLISSPAD